jgi:hypothetical protein
MTFSKYIPVVLFLSAIFSHAFSEQMLQPRRLVDAHTAGVLPRASFDFDSRIFSADSNLGAGIIMGIAVGITNRLNIGISYGGEGLVGRGRHARFNSLPGWLFKYRIFDSIKRKQRSVILIFAGPVNIRTVYPFLIAYRIPHSLLIL